MSRSHSRFFRTLKLILNTSTTIIYYKCRKVTKPTVTTMYVKTCDLALFRSDTDRIL